MVQQQTMGWYEKKEERFRNGADRVAGDPAEITVDPADPAAVLTTRQLPSALEHWGAIRARIGGRKAAVFLDYDGTLTPIVARPEEAKLSVSMRRTLQALSRKCLVAVISGRELEDVQQRVGIDTVLYAGSHGFDIFGRGLQYRHGLDFLPELDRAEQILIQDLPEIQGVRMERKKFSIAIHFRQARGKDVALLEKTLEDILQDFPRLRKTGGKKVFECRPDIDWHKGKALEWILEKLELDRRAVLPLYIGDDLTDEDAFRVLMRDGIGIVVRDEPRSSMAAFALNSVREVKRFLDLLEGAF